MYEADPKHIDLLAAAFNLEKANGVGTPGIKEKTLNAMPKRAQIPTTLNSGKRNVQSKIVRSAMASQCAH